MPFPLVLSGITYANGPALLAAVLEDAEAGGGRVFPGRPVSQWVAEQVGAGSIDRELALSLAAAMLRTPKASVVAEGARLAVAVRDPRLDRMIFHALNGHDTGLLLHVDTSGEAQSVEDVLLRAWAAVAPLAEVEVRVPLLEQLRNAGLSDLELAILCEHGDAGEIARFVPAVFAEGIPAGAGASLAGGLKRGGEAQAAIEAALGTLSPPLRETVRVLVQANGCDFAL